MANEKIQFIFVLKLIPALCHREIWTEKEKISYRVTSLNNSNFFGKADWSRQAKPQELMMKTPSASWFWRLNPRTKPWRSWIMTLP